MAILDEGKIVFEGMPSSLISDAQGRVWEFVVKENELDAVKSQYRVVRTVATSGGLKIRAVGDRPQGDSVESAVPTLEDAYVLFMGDRLVKDQESAAAGGTP
jgi:hypothetical protein